MARLLAWLGGRGTWVLFGGVFIGLLAPGLAALCRPLLAPAVVVLLLAALLRVDWRTLADYARRPILAAVLTAWLMVASPLVLWLLLPVLGPPEALGAALVLMAAAPPILAATAISLMLGLDAALALVAGLISTLLTPLTVPPLALALLGIELEIGVGEFMLRLGLVVGGAFLGAALFRRIAGAAWLARHGPAIDGVVIATMLVFAVAIMDGVTAALAQRPGTVALWLAAAFLANPLLQLAGALLFSWLGLRGALTVGLLSGNCNMGLLLAALPPDSDFDIALFFAVAQLPMYMLPAMTLPLYRKLLRWHGKFRGSES